MSKNPLETAEGSGRLELMVRCVMGFYRIIRGLENFETSLGVSEIGKLERVALISELIALRSHHVTDAMSSSFTLFTQRNPPMLFKVLPVIS